MANKNFKRKKLRLENYDYSQPGMYFITICINNRLKLLGEIIEGSFQPFDNRPDQIITDGLHKTCNYYSHVSLDEYIIMPNHIHFILDIHQPIEFQLSDIIKSFKLYTTKKYSQGVKKGLFLPYQQRLWQKSFYDHIIRNDKDLYQTRKYILDNPMKWHLDELYID